MSALATLPYVGATQAGSGDLVDEAYLTTLLGANLAQATVTTLINTGLTGYCPTSYVNTQAALNATKAQVDAGDAARLHLSQIGANGGVAGLNSVSGRIDGSHLSLTSTQRFPSPLYSPTSYWGTNQVATTTEVQLDTLVVTNPGYTFKALITGLVDGQTSTDGQYPIIRVRQGSTTGPVVAVGAGISEQYAAGLMYPYTNPGAGQIWTVPSWLYAVNRVALGAGGGGGGSFFFQGQGGTAGAFAEDTLLYGSSLPTSTPILTVNVGAGGAAGTSSVGATNGGATSITGISVASLTGAGGVGQGNTFNSQGQGAGSVAYGGNTFKGGVVQATAGGTGNAPGGGGASGAFGGVAAGGAGANGAAWLFAYPNPNIPGGPIVLMPTPLNAQTSMTATTTFYVMLVTSGAGSVTATTLTPLLQATPFPA